MTTRKRPGGRREPPGGRPPKGNSRLVCYVKPETRSYIDSEAEKTGATLGEIVDRLVQERQPAHRPKGEQDDGGSN